MDDDGRSGEPRGRLARGTMPYAVTSQRNAAGTAMRIAQPSAADEPARSITEAIERLVATEAATEATEAATEAANDAANEAADEALAEWMQGER